MFVVVYVIKIKEKEARSQGLQQEIDQLQLKLREAREELIEKDGQIKLTALNLSNIEKQRKLLSDEVVFLIIFVNKKQQTKYFIWKT